MKMKKDTKYFICASGPSLTQQDINAVRDKGVVIVINNTYQLAPWANILYGCDQKWWKAYPEALDFKGRKISIQFDNENVEKWESNSCLNGLGEDIIHTGGNSGYQAINLAYLLGAKEIVLLGFDMQRTQGKGHWHGDHVRNLSNQSNFKVWIGHFYILSQNLKQKGIKVFNCSRQTALECFERKELKEVL